MLKKIGYSIKEAIKQIFRNFGMCLVSFFSITAILIILGAFFAIIVNINNMAESVKTQFGIVQIHLKDGVDKKEAETLGLYLKEQDPNVASISYKSKKEALNEMKEKWGKNAVLLDEYAKNNPFPNSLVVKMKNIEGTEDFVKMAEGLDNIEQISYHQDTVSKIISVANFIKLIGVIIVVSLIIISIFVVNNTIKLTIIARKNEIEIMKNVGATNWLVRGPFLVEGIFIGLISSGISIGLISLLYNYISTKIGLVMSMQFGVPLVDEKFMLTNLIYIFVSLGVSVGAVGSLISIHKFLEPKKKR